MDIRFEAGKSLLERRVCRCYRNPCVVKQDCKVSGRWQTILLDLPSNSALILSLRMSRLTPRQLEKRGQGNLQYVSRGRGEARGWSPLSVSSHSADSPVQGCTDVVVAAVTTGRLWRAACNETAVDRCATVCYLRATDKAGRRDCVGDKNDC